MLKKQDRICKYCYSDFSGARLFCSQTCSIRYDRAKVLNSAIDRLQRRWDILYRIAPKAIQQQMIKIENKIPLCEEQ